MTSACSKVNTDIGDANDDKGKGDLNDNNESNDNKQREAPPRHRKDTRLDVA